MNQTDLLLKALQAHSNPQKAAGQQRFFKTGKGEYAQGDRFLGVPLPQLRLTVKAFWQKTGFDDLEKLFASPWHEARAAAALLLVEQFEKSKNPAEKKAIFDFYVAHLPCCNNWDLIDISAYKIIGAYLYDKKDRSLFYRLAHSSNLWQQRAAVVGTMYLVKRGDFAVTLDLAEIFLDHPHDLMHKAVGWLLREVGKKEEGVLCAFLDKHYRRMPRTMLRYALERLPDKKKKFYMQIQRYEDKLNK